MKYRNYIITEKKELVLITRKFVAAVLLLVACFFYYDIQTVKHKAEDTVQTVVGEPLTQIGDMISNPGYTPEILQNPDEYQKKSRTKLADFSWSYYKLRGETAAAAGSFVTGISLLLFGGNRRDENEFTENVFNFFRKR